MKILKSNPVNNKMNLIHNHHEINSKINSFVTANSENDLSYSNKKISVNEKRSLMWEDLFGLHISGSFIKVMICMQNIADNELDTFYHSINSIAKLCKQSRRTVERATAFFESHGFLEKYQQKKKVNGRWQTNRYRLIYGTPPVRQLVADNLSSSLSISNNNHSIVKEVEKSVPESYEPTGKAELLWKKTCTETNECRDETLKAVRREMILLKTHPDGREWTQQTCNYFMIKKMFDLQKYHKNPGVNGQIRIPMFRRMNYRFNQLQSQNLTKNEIVEVDRSPEKAYSAPKITKTVNEVNHRDGSCDELEGLLEAFRANNAKMLN